MNKADLISTIAQAAGISKAQAQKTMEITFDTIRTALQQGDDVRLVGFGTFTVAKRAASEGRNPRTGEKIEIAARRQPKFRPGQELKDAVNK